MLQLLIDSIAYIFIKNKNKIIKWILRPKCLGFSVSRKSVQLSFIAVNTTETPTSVATTYAKETCTST